MDLEKGIDNLYSIIILYGWTTVQNIDCFRETLYKNLFILGFSFISVWGLYVICYILFQISQEVTSLKCESLNICNKC